MNLNEQVKKPVEKWDKRFTESTSTWISVSKSHLLRMQRVFVYLKSFLVFSWAEHINITRCIYSIETNLFKEIPYQIIPLSIIETESDLILYV